MGAWGHSLLENDTICDEIIEFQKLSPKEIPSYLNTLRNKAHQESKQYQVTADDLPLEYDGSEEEALANLVPADQDTESRAIFLGILHFMVNNNIPVSNPNKTSAFEFIKELSHKHNISGWSNPMERFNELYKFKLLLEKKS